MPDDALMRWQPRREVVPPPWPNPPMNVHIGRGIAGRCPACGEAPLFAGYLRVVAMCANCKAPLGQLRSDDAPAYVTILIVGHVVVGLLVLMETSLAPPLWLEAIILLPLTLVLSLLLLPMVKGAILAVILRVGMIKPPQ